MVAGESHFDRPEFVEILECFHKYGGKHEELSMYYAIEEQKRVNSGEFLTFWMPVSFLPGYSEFMLEYGTVRIWFIIREKIQIRGIGQGNIFLW